MRTATSFVKIFLFIPLLIIACDSSDPEPQEPEPEVSENCIIHTRELANSTGIDAIPALTDPKMIPADQAFYLRDTDLVVGIQNGDLTLAVPHNVLNWHEVVNLTETSPQLAVTFCPLTGSAITFDRTAVGNLEFGVSGLLWRNNNVMFDRSEDAFSLWSQMGSVALCDISGEPGKQLPPYPNVEMTWAGWKSLHPETLVLSDETGFARNYEVNPLGNYINPANTEIFWPMPGPADTRRLPKERILGLPDEQGGLSLPFDELDKLGAIAVLHTNFQGIPIVVFYDRDKRAAWSFWLNEGNIGRTFEVVGSTIRDTSTNSTWSLDGRAVDGTLAGSQLTPIAQAYVSYWFAWSVFQPDATLWEAG